MPLFFAVTLFVSAFLLFLVQPMIAKMVLPRLGGTPAVWNTCMVFFQAALLAGYVYAHVSTTRLGLRRQTVLHLLLLLLPFLVLPIGVASGWEPPEGDNPALWLLLILVLSVGLPFFVVSTSAPLLQKWFAGTGHPSAKDPYFLYAASNLGSMIALLGYPVLLEPQLRLADQSLLWMAGYGLFVALMFGCALFVWRAPRAALATSLAEPVSGFEPAATPSGEPLEMAEAPPTTVTGVRRLHWLALAFVPSSLMLGTTTYLTTDVAAIPLLWVVPLAIYLLTFILAFSRLPHFVHLVMTWLLPFAIIMTVLTYRVSMPYWVTIVIHLSLLFLGAMVCHGELARLRPATDHLTEYYIWMSLGGVMGGMFNALVAPLLFTDVVVEYGIVIVLAAMLRPTSDPSKAGRGNLPLDFGLALGVGAVTAALVLGLNQSTSEWWTNLSSQAQMGIVYGVPLLLCFVFVDRPVRFGLAIGVVLLTFVACYNWERVILHRDRSFFGVLEVMKEVVEDGAGEKHVYHRLHHGTTLHGKQARDPSRLREPISYYHRTGPVGQFFDAMKPRLDKARFAIVGLGSGTMACYAEPGQTWTFYEIDRAVERIANDARFFTFLQDSPAVPTIVLGDARLTLAKAPDGSYDFIFLDAFSSDAVPVHLLTREAFEIYRSKLAPGGVLMVHISNRYLDLEPIIANVAASVDMAARHGSDGEDPSIDKTGSHWVAVARTDKDLGGLTEDERWPVLHADSSKPLWTDDFSNLLSVFRW